LSPAHFVRIAANVPQVAGLFDYRIPDDLDGRIQAGSLVTIPFGRQTVQGIVIGLLDEPSVSNPKEIISLLDEEPVFTSHQIKLALWMAEQNLSSLAACLDLMLPPGLAKQADMLIHLVEQSSSIELTPLQTRIVNLLEKRGDLRGKQLDRSLPNIDWRKSLPGLVKKGVVISHPILQEPTAKAKTGRALLLIKMPVTQDEHTKLGRPGSSACGRRFKILQFLEKEGKAVIFPFVQAETGAVAADLRPLEEGGFIQIVDIEIQRDPLLNFVPIQTTPPQLTPEQASVVDALKAQFSAGSALKPNLLQGVTSSGKTEVYLRAVEETLQRGRQAVILVPEISLTPQTVSRFMSRFPEKVALIHSRLSEGERYDTWRRIRSGQVSIVVGARSALFAPLSDPGLIVIDECHDGSYHQEDFDPRYDAISASLTYAKESAAVFLMGSATPEVEQLHLFKERKWNIFHLPNRVLAHQGAHPLSGKEAETAFPLPKIEVVDMRAELVANNRSPLSRALQAGLQQVLDDGHQAILFLNRRGSASYVFCRDCGYVLKCSRCNNPMTYHESGAQLVCHRCNTRRLMPKTCPQCGSTRIKQFGLGTESLEKMVAELFPQARLLRWDADTARKKGAHDLIMDHFVQGRADVLIGTQMIAKGLDIPNVTLVGMILADVSLNLPDFRAAERTFQLITQVAGRAGRSALGGKVILQTFNPDHYAIQKAAAYDFAGFEKTELAYRREMNYPPFSRMVKIELKHFNPTFLETSARKVGELMQSWIFEKGADDTSLIGPAPCFYQRTAGQYRWQIILRGQNPVELLREHPLQSWQPNGVNVKITVDPIDLL